MKWFVFLGEGRVVSPPMQFAEMWYTRRQQADEKAAFLAGLNGEYARVIRSDGRCMAVFDAFGNKTKGS
jgi:hypothetical protein